MKTTQLHQIRGLVRLLNVSIAGAFILSLSPNPSARAAGLVETFSYSNGNLTPNGGWQRYDPTFNPFDPNAGDATVVNGAARYEDSTDVLRFFPAILTAPGQTATWSFTINIAVANTSEGYETSLQPASAPFSANVNYASGFSIGFDYVAAPAGRSSIQVGEGVPNNTGPVVGSMTAGVTHTIRVDMARGAANTAYSLFLDNNLLTTRSFVLNDARGLNSIEFDQFGGAPAPGGSARLDDINVVPEPATGAMLAFTSATLLSLRRRRHHP